MADERLDIFIFGYGTSLSPVRGLCLCIDGVSGILVVCFFAFLG